MKIIRSIFILIAAASMTEVFAQGLELQAVIRPALTSLRGNPLIEDAFNPAINISAGVGANYFITDKSLINIGLLYDRKGGADKGNTRDEDNQPGGSLTFRSNFHYITVPVQWGTRFGKKVKYQFGVGAYAALLLQHKYVTKGAIEHVESGTDNYKRTDFGLSASFAVLMPLNESWFINLGLNDNLGLVNVSDVPVANDGTIKHNSLGLTIGVNFKIK